MDADVFDAFAALVAYPVAGFPARFAEARAALAAEDASWAAYVEPLGRMVAADEPAQVEELYTRTFDMNPSSALETGWHLYGEDYDRGAFLVRVRQLMRSVGVEESGELPDHLSHVLRLIARLDVEEATELSRRQVLPALHKILAALGETENPYRDVLAGAAALLAARFGPADDVPASAFACPAPYEEQGGAFLCPGMPSPKPE